MNSLPRRSPRLSQIQQEASSNTSFSSSSQDSSVVQSSFPSPGSEPSQQEQLRLQRQSEYPSAAQHFNPPLPSPSTTEFNPFFQQTHSHSTTFDMPQHSHQKMTQAGQHAGRTSSTKSQPPTMQHHNSFSSQQRPNVYSGNKSGQLPPDFLAEAARRAQMACLMRDMEDVTL